MMTCYSSDYSSSLTLKFTNFQQDDWTNYECVVQDRRNESVHVSPLNIVVIRKLASSESCSRIVCDFVYFLFVSIELYPTVVVFVPVIFQLVVTLYITNVIW